MSELVRQLNERLTQVTAERDALAKLGMWSCKACGPHVRSRANWCERGCGSDYQEMTWVSDGQSLADVRAELSELRARVERAKKIVDAAADYVSHDIARRSCSEPFYSECYREHREYVEEAWEVLADATRGLPGCYAATGKAPIFTAMGLDEPEFPTIKRGEK